MPPLEKISLAAATGGGLFATLWLLRSLQAKLPNQPSQSSSDNPSGIPSGIPSGSEAHSASFVKIVLQRFNSASLVVRGDRRKADTCGLMVYVSFAGFPDLKSAKQNISKAAKTVANLPLVTSTQWGDENNPPRSLLSLIKSNETGLVPSLVIVPQANLVCKAKGGGKQLQYHGQSNKSVSSVLYDQFVSEMASLFSPEDPSLSETDKKKQSTSDTVVDPLIMFRELDEYRGLYIQFDEKGLPTKLADGCELTKSATKKCKKLQGAMAKRFMKAKTQGKAPSFPSARAPAPAPAPAPASVPAPAPAPAKINIISGVFGDLQAITMDAACGPFVHVLEI